MHKAINSKLNLSLMIVAFSALAGLATLVRVLSPYMFAATVAYLLMLSGFLIRKKSSLWHSRLMMSAMALDLLLVIILEAQRNVVVTAFDPSLNNLQRAHVAFSSGATLLYLPMIFLGFRLKKKPAMASRKWHVSLGIATFILRSLGFILMFSLIGRPSA